MSFRHLHCGGSHSRADEARECQGRPATSKPSIPTMVRYWDAQPTEPQIWKVGRAGGDQEHARTLNRGECSEYIDSLIGRTVSTEIDTTEPKSSPQPSMLPIDLLGHVPSGRYAVRPSESHAWRFYRLTRPRSGQFAGHLKVQSQHSDRFALVLTVRSDGRLTWYNQAAESDLLILIADHQWAAVMYSQQTQRCCRCGVQLTHEDSLRYGIGPECVKYWPWVPERLEQAGPGGR